MERVRHLYRVLFVLFAVVFAMSDAYAQKFIVAPFAADSARMTLVTLTDTVWKDATSHSVRMIEPGVEFDAAAPVMKYGAVAEIDGKHYRISFRDLEFSPSNAPEAVNPMSAEQQRRHTAFGKFYGSTAPIWVGVMLLAAIAVFFFAGTRFPQCRKVGCAVVPVCIALVALLDLGGYFFLGSDAFWWCDYDRYGFWGSLFRFIPFAGAVAVQVISIKWYEILLFDDADNDGDDGARRKISLKPALFGILCCIPVAIVYALVAQAWLDFRGTASDVIGVCLFFLTLVGGLFMAFRKNVKTFGKAKGTAVTVFTIIYILGCAVAVGTLIVLLFRLLLQILIVAGIVFMIMVIGSSKTRVKDSYGNVYEEDGFGNRTRIY